MFHYKLKRPGVDLSGSQVVQLDGETLKEALYSRLGKISILNLLQGTMHTERIQKVELAFHAPDTDSFHYPFQMIDVIVFRLSEDGKTGRPAAPDRVLLPKIETLEVSGSGGFLELGPEGRTSSDYLNAKEIRTLSNPSLSEAGHEVYKVAVISSSHVSEADWDNNPAWIMEGQHTRLLQCCETFWDGENNVDRAQIESEYIAKLLVWAKKYGYDYVLVDVDAKDVPELS